MLLDLQILTIYRDLRRALPAFRGKVLDVGCGQSPYRFLLDPTQASYQGIDIADAAKFDYHNADIVPFNGQDIPFADGSFDAFLCTEVLEHVQGYQHLVDEMHRVSKPGARGVVTVPWSARYHYIPFDYFRYTPSALKVMFARFSEVDIRPRGTDVSAIAAKLVAMFFRNLLPGLSWKLVLLPLWLALLPLLALSLVVAHLSLWLGFGSSDDPLGYTVMVRR